MLQWYKRGTAYQFTVWKVSIILGDVDMIICNVRRATEVVTVIEEGFLFRSIV